MAPRKSDNPDLKLGPDYAEIGGLVAQDIERDPEGAFLYTEVEKGMIFTSIFIDIGDRVIYRSASQDLIDKIYKTWMKIRPNNRWATISYTITGGKFNASFQFPEEIKENEEAEDRLIRILKERYGEKPVEFPDR
jgi:hypothetical protein